MWFRKRSAPTSRNGQVRTKGYLRCGQCYVIPAHARSAVVIQVVCDPQPVACGIGHFPNLRVERRSVFRQRKHDSRAVPKPGELRRIRPHVSTQPLFCSRIHGHCFQQIFVRIFVRCFQYRNAPAIRRPRWPGRREGSRQRHIHQSPRSTAVGVRQHQSGSHVFRRLPHEHELLSIRRKTDRAVHIEKDLPRSSPE